MTNEELLYLQLKPRLIDYLKAAALPYWEPELTLCPHCGEYAGIINESMWSCTHCGRHGDLIDYVMSLNHFETPSAALKQICRTLKIKITTLDVISATDLMDQYFEGSDMIIEHLIGRGIYLIAGAPKIGKSWLILWLAHCVSQGYPVWGFKTRKCDVLYISLEDPEMRLQSRIAQITQGETGSGTLFLATDAEFIGRGFEDQITGFLNDHDSVKFIIIDTLQKIRQASSGQYSYASDYEIISQLKSIADRYNITILLVHHTRKASASDPFAAISGTTGLSGGVDGSLVLIKNDRMDNRAKLYVTGRDVLDMELELLFDRETATWQFLGYGTKEQIQKRDRLLTELDLYLSDVGSFVGSASVLLAALTQRSDLQIKSANALTRLLNPQKNYLRHEYGICYKQDRSKKERTIYLSKLSSDDSDNIM